MTLNETVFIVAVAILLLKLLLLTFVAPVMTCELAHSLVIPAQGFAEPADMTGSNLDSATSSSAQLTGQFFLRFHKCF